MKIKISKEAGGGLVVDAVEFPGSPPVGRGRTIAEAMGDFLIFYQDRLGVEIDVDLSIEEADRQRLIDSKKVWDLY